MSTVSYTLCDFCDQKIPSDRPVSYQVVIRKKVTQPYTLQTTAPGFTTTTNQFFNVTDNALTKDMCGRCYDKLKKDDEPYIPELETVRG